MNFMEKENNSSHGYYGEDQEDQRDITTTSLTSIGATELDLGLGTGGGTMAVVEREHMFDKVVTPSDVGKLNRLVIPKQHAERYFPLDSSTNDKGLLLNFEDSNGKSWRFRYSYWNSSQSYVMTKGWSRFVKDKKLDPGDIVSFHRGKGHFAKDRLFIEWRRRPDHPPNPNPNLMPSFSIHPGHPYYFSGGSNLQRGPPAGPLCSTGPPLSGGLFLRGGGHCYSTIATARTYGGDMGGASHHHAMNNPNPSGNSLMYFRSSPIAPHHQQQLSLEEVGVDRDMFLPSVPVVPGKAAAKRLRLFGVNMDCPISDSSEDEEEEHDHSIVLPSTTIGHHPHTPMVQLRLYNNGGSSSPQILPRRHQMQFHSDYLDHNKGKGIE